jgi:hypothetical protein
MLSVYVGQSACLSVTLTSYVLVSYYGLAKFKVRSAHIALNPAS